MADVVALADFDQGLASLSPCQGFVDLEACGQTSLPALERAFSAFACSGFD
jgi:hypothetical protein